MVDPPRPPSHILRARQPFIPDWRLFFKTRWKVIVLCLIGVLFVEVFVFNLPTWQTLRSLPEEESVSTAHMEGAKAESGGIVTTSSGATVNVTSKRIIKYLYLEVSPQYENVSRTVNYSVGISYEGDKYVHYGSAMTMDLGVKDDRYVNAGSYVRSVTIQFDVPKGTFIPVTGITVNPKIPYRFSLLRLCMLLLLISFWILLGPGSVLWKMEIDTGSLFHLTLLCLATLAVAFFYFVTWYFNGNGYVWGGLVKLVKEPSGIWISDTQYQNLANSLLHGHTWLNLPVSAGLKSLKNPYSLSARLAIGKQGQFSFWDHAFYHGKYYCYYGIIPALIFFVPYQFFTGHYLSTGWAILTALMIATVFATLLIVRIAKLYFADASVGTVLSAIWILGLGCGLLQEAFVADYYEVPEASSYMFTVLGLWCWLKSLKKRRRIGTKYVSPWWIFFGSLFMACNLGCRPAFTVFIFLAIPIFWTAVFKDRTLFSRKGLWPTIFFAIPFFLVFIPLFLYNYDRFGSILNFGENYNLTGFDMVRAKRPDLPFLLTFTTLYYLFQPMNIVGTFPFIASIRVTAPLWYPSWDPVGGGYFTLMAPCIFILFVIAPWILSRRRRKELDRTFSGNYSTVESTRRTVISLVSLSVASGICAALMTAQYVGYTQRYSGFFGLFFAVAGIFLLFSSLPAWSSREEGHRNMFTLLKILLVAFLTLTCIWEFLGFSIFIQVFKQDVNYFKIASWFLFMN